MERGGTDGESGIRTLRKVLWQVVLDSEAGAKEARGGDGEPTRVVFLEAGRCCGPGRGEQERAGPLVRLQRGGLPALLPPGRRVWATADEPEQEDSDALN